MNKLKNMKNWILSLLFAGVVIACFAIFFNLTQNETDEIFLTPMFDDAKGWEIYTYTDNEYISLTPTEAFQLENQVYYLSRTLDESYMKAGLTTLRFNYTEPCAIFLDDTLFYTNISNLSGEINQLDLPHTTFKVPKAGENAIAALPPDYAGKVLTFATINVEKKLLPYILLSSSSNERTATATEVNRIILPTTFTAICALFLFGMWLYSGAIGKWDLSILLLLAASLIQTFYNLLKLEYYYPDMALLDIPLLNISQPLFVYLPMLYLCMKMNKYRKLCTGLILIPAVSTTLFAFALVMGWVNATVLYGLWQLLVPSLLVLIVFSNLERRHKNKIFQIFVSAYMILFVSILIFYILSLFNTGFFADYINSTLYNYFFDISIPILLIGWTGTLLFLLCLLTSFIDLIQRSISVKTDMQALSLRNELAYNNLQLMKQSSEELAKMRHNMLHHFNVLTALNQKDDREHIAEYLTHISNQSEKILPLCICQHSIVNAIVLGALNRAQEAEIDMQYQINLPETMAINDVDLYNFLINLLDNAIDAAALVPEKQNRWIKCTIHIRGNYLFIEAENTYTGVIEINAQGLCDSTKGSHHGYGMKTMLDITLRYHSDLQVDISPKTFLVRTALLLRNGN